MNPRYLFGFHAIAARMRTQPDSVRALWVDEGRDDPRARQLITRAEGAGVRVLTAATARLDGMAHGARHQGVVAEVADTAPRWGSLEDLLDGLAEPALLVLLDGVTDPHNLGAVLRAADGAGAHAVVAPRDRAVGVSAAVARVASGAAEAVPYFMVPNLAREMSELRERGLSTIGLADDSPGNLYGCSLDRAIAFVLGAEGAGLRRLTRERCDDVVRIPMHGTVDSLNVAVAAGVCLYEARRQRAGGAASARGGTASTAGGAGASASNGG